MTINLRMYLFFRRFNDLLFDEMHFLTHIKIFITQKSSLFRNQYFESLLYIVCYSKEKVSGILFDTVLGVKQQSFEDVVFLIYRLWQG